VTKEVKAIARERVGRVPASRPIEDRPPKKPKHKKRPGEELE